MKKILFILFLLFSISTFSSWKNEGIFGPTTRMSKSVNNGTQGLWLDKFSEWMVGADESLEIAVSQNLAGEDKVLLGVFLGPEITAGKIYSLRIKIDDGETIEVTGVGLPNIDFILLDISDGIMNKIKKGNKLVIATRDENNEIFKLTTDLEGFNDAYNKVKNAKTNFPLWSSDELSDDFGDNTGRITMIKFLNNHTQLLKLEKYGDNVRLVVKMGSKVTFRKIYSLKMKIDDKETIEITGEGLGYSDLIGLNISDDIMNRIKKGNKLDIVIYNEDGSIVKLTTGLMGFNDAYNKVKKAKLKDSPWESPEISFFYSRMDTMTKRINDYTQSLKLEKFEDKIRLSVNMGSKSTVGKEYSLKMKIDDKETIEITGIGLAYDYIELKTDDSTMDRIKKGNKLEIVAYNDEGKSVKLTTSLEGFRDAYNNVEHGKTSWSSYKSEEEDEFGDKIERIKMRRSVARFMQLQLRKFGGKVKLDVDMRLHASSRKLYSLKMKIDDGEAIEITGVGSSHGTIALDISDDIMNRIKKGNKLEIVAYDEEGKSYELITSLEGFIDAYNKVK